MGFRVADRDGSGQLDLQEFGRAVNTEMGLGLSAEEVQETFARFDGDSDGFVSIEELVREIVAHHPEDDYCLTAFKVDTDFDWYERSMDAAKISCPVLLIHGRSDRVVRFEDAGEFVGKTS